MKAKEIGHLTLEIIEYSFVGLLTVIVIPFAIAAYLMGMALDSVKDE